MWELKIEAPATEVYDRLRAAFQNEHIIEVEQPLTYPKDRVSTKFDDRGPNKIAYSEEGVSEQFRAIAKSVQSMLPLLEGTITVDCGGEPGKSMYLTVGVS